MAAGTASAVAWPTSGAAAASGGASFLAVANADGVRVGALAKGYLVVEQLADVGSPTAQALTSGIDNSGYAGFPWPGADVLGAQGTVNGAVGQPVADYPAAVSNESSPKSDRSTPPAVTLKATTDEAGSTALASGGVISDAATVSRAEAKATSHHDAAGTSTATASTIVDGISVGGVLRIGGVAAEATATESLTAPRKVSSSLSVAEVRVVGQVVGFSDKGLTVAGTTVPLPHDNPLAHALAEQGISVSYLAAEKTALGITSAGMRVTVVQRVPTLPEPVQISYLFGRASASARAGGAVETATGSGAVPGSIGASGGDGSTTSGASPAPALAPAQPSTALPGSSAVPQPVSGNGTAGAAAPSVARPPEQLASRRAALSYDPAMFYLVLVLGGVLLVGGAQLLRLFGVRVLWSE